MIMLSSAPAVAEEELTLSGPDGSPAIALRHEPGPGPTVLYVHGSTFPSALSIAYRIDGRSWMDDLRERGLDVWAFDFVGYGESDHPAAMKETGARAVPFGRSAEAADQIERVVQFILKKEDKKRVSLIAHSWGTIPAAVFAIRRPEMVDRLVLFGPVAERQGPPTEPMRSASLLVSAEDQWQGFHSGLPAGQGPLISRSVFDPWASAYLRTDAESGTRTPRAVLVPSGPSADVAEAWTGHLPYDPRAVTSKTLVVRGEWDSVTRDVDAAWLVSKLTAVPGGARDIKLPRGSHRMHLEENRQVLFDAVGKFLLSPSTS
jgi:pimeloyl-ACP methyl ester carboxylesterase